MVSNVTYDQAGWPWIRGSHVGTRVFLSTFGLIPPALPSRSCRLLVFFLYTDFRGKLPAPKTIGLGNIARLVSGMKEQRNACSGDWFPSLGT